VFVVSCEHCILHCAVIVDRILVSLMDTLHVNRLVHGLLLAADLVRP